MHAPASRCHGTEAASLCTVSCWVCQQIRLPFNGFGGWAQGEKAAASKKLCPHSVPTGPGTPACRVDIRSWPRGDRTEQPGRTAFPGPPIRFLRRPVPALGKSQRSVPDSSRRMTAAKHRPFTDAHGSSKEGKTDHAPGDSVRRRTGSAPRQCPRTNRRKHPPRQPASTLPTPGSCPPRRQGRELKANDPSSPLTQFAPDRSPQRWPARLPRARADIDTLFFGLVCGIYGGPAGPHRGRRGCPPRKSRRSPQSPSNSRPVHSPDEVSAANWRASRLTLNEESSHRTPRAAPAGVPDFCVLNRSAHLTRGAGDLFPRHAPESTRDRRANAGLFAPPACSTPR